MLAPFAGGGATLFCASDLGIEALGIELLPIGQHIIKARNLLHCFSNDDFETLIQWKNKKPWIEHQGQHSFTVLKITDGAYSTENSSLIKKFLSCMRRENENVQTVLLQQIIEYLYSKKANKTLNNNGIPRMVKAYFYEMACVIHELYRILAPGGEIIMVNDNVRYAGASISVDLILSDIAAKTGFQIEEISILPIGKGNSSQQMGAHGREALRKCVYIWRKK